MAAIKARCFVRRGKKILAQVNVEIVKRSDHAKGLSCCPNGGLSNAPSPGSDGAGVWQRLGEPQSQGARIPPPRFNRAHAEKAMQSRMISPDKDSEALKEPSPNKVDANQCVVGSNYQNG